MGVRSGRHQVVHGLARIAPGDQALPHEHRCGVLPLLGALAAMIVYKYV